jgi:precorrin-3B synthase
METGDGLLVRVRASGGRLSLDQAQAMAEAAQACGSGIIGLSSRGNLQIRGVSEATLSDLHQRLDAAGLLDADPEVERLRNIVVSPLSDIDPDAAFDLAPSLRALEARLREDEALRTIPAKFGFILDAQGRLPLGDLDADIRFEAARDGTFAAYLGGEDALAATCAAGDMADVAARLASAFLSLRSAASYSFKHRPLPACGESEGVRGAASLDERAIPRRMRALVETLGASAVFAEAGFGAGARSRSPTRAALSDALGVHEFGGATVVGAAAPFGHVDARSFKNLIERARSSGASELRLSPWRMLFFRRLAAKGAGSFAASCAELGFVVDADDALLRVAACPGAPACSHALGPVREDARNWAGLLPKAEGVILHVSGCAKGCARSHATAATLVATENGYDLVVNGKAGDIPSRRRLSREAVGIWLASDGAKVFAAGGTPA